MAASADNQEHEPRLRVGTIGHRATARLAWAVCAVSLLLMAFTLLLIVLGWSTPLPRGWDPWASQAVNIAGFVGAPILGGIVASRRPENPYGWLWLGLSLGFGLVSFAGAYAAYALVAEPGSLPAPRTVSNVLGMGWAVGVVFLPFLLLLFPNGRLPSQRWRPVAWAVSISGAVLLTIGWFAPGRSGIGPFENPLGVGGVVGEAIVFITNAVVYALFVAIFLSAASLVFRYRRAGGVERQQIKWFALAAVLFASYILVNEFLYQPPGAWDVLLEAATSLGLYAAIGVAILRYRLYDIDLIINRTLVYGSLTTALVAVYFGGVATTQGIFRTLTGQEQQPQLAIIVSTLVIAALFNPLRRRIQGFIDRRFYRSRYNATKTLEAFSAKLRDETDLDTLSDDLVRVVRETMHPAHVYLWLRPEKAAKGEPTD
jgi:hypothetical protein